MVQFAQPKHRHASPHPIFRFGQRMLGGIPIKLLRLPVRDISHDLTTKCTTALHDQKVSAGLLHLGDGQVKPSVGPGPRLHRGAKTGSAGPDTVHGNDAEVLTHFGVVVILVAAPQKHLVVYAHGGQLTRADPEEGVPGRWFSR
jgi:hypothetical protein